MAPRFQFVRVQGSRYEIGCQLGELLREKILRVIDQIIDAEIPDNCRRRSGSQQLRGPFTREQILARTHDFVPRFESYCPTMLDELRGIARGASISLEEALLLQIRGEVLYAMAGGCSSFVFSRQVTREGQVITGQNWDYPIDLDLMIVLHTTPDDAPSQLMMTFAGLTSYMGINSYGVSQFANALPWGMCRIGIPHYPFKWQVFMQRDLEGVRRLAEKTDTVLPGNYVLSDSKGNIADLELTPEGIAWLTAEEGFIVHTNHFLGEPFASRPDLEPRPDSLTRYERLRILAEQNLGAIDVPLMQQILADHENYPVSLCRYVLEPGTDTGTAASLIAEPEKGLLHVCAGNPCLGEFVTYSL
ncbi:MAG TPA: C45 family autoproteolytic acyltransferase/hydrolase [Anaerolineae bacterium]|nr:C45 family autoproteolytic acyltransferase/hydrolase [Anaerolineae bacterium]